MLIGGASNDGEEAPSSTNSKSNRFVDIFREQLRIRPSVPCSAEILEYSKRSTCGAATLSGAFWEVLACSAL